jgi:hypothetical protein
VSLVKDIRLAREIVTSRSFWKQVILVNALVIASFSFPSWFGEKSDASQNYQQKKISGSFEKCGGGTKFSDAFFVVRLPNEPHLKAINFPAKNLRQNTNIRKVICGLRKGVGITVETVFIDSRTYETDYPFHISMSGGKVIFHEDLQALKARFEQKASQRVLGVEPAIYVLSLLMIFLFQLLEKKHAIRKLKPSKQKNR